MVELTRVRDGDRVYIDCATGALGQMCFQLLKEKSRIRLYGGTTSPEKKEFIKSLGAIPIVQGEHEKGQYYDVVLNSRGGKSLKKDYDHLAPCGRMVVLGLSSAVGPGQKHWGKILSTVYETLLSMVRFPLWKLMMDNKGVMGLNVLQYLEQNEKAFVLFQDRDLSNFPPPKVDTSFPASQVGEAHEYIEQKKAKGKVLLSWENE